ncbi:ribosome recycling factor family protein [Pseudoalteromonas sp. Of7M-16]|nr:ribosome recycling factor family protein [Pseudoalteromonas sp. Of7M-16]
MYDKLFNSSSPTPFKPRQTTDNFDTLLVRFPTHVRMLDIQLNSFVRRVERADKLKALIKSSGAQLNRKGRSRHWRIQGDWSQLELIIQQIQQYDEPSWQWIVEKLRCHKPKSSLEGLVSIVKHNPTITLQQLIAQTDCTLVEARKAFDEVAWD